MKRKQTTTRYELHITGLGQHQYVGSFDSNEAAQRAMQERGDCRFNYVASIPSGADSVDIYACMIDGVFNYCTAHITIIH